MTEPTVIRYQAQVFKVQTLIDGGIRVTLDLVAPVDPQTIVALFDAKQPGVLLECASVAIVVSDTLTKLDDETKKSAKRSGTHMDRRRFAVGRNKQAGVAV